MKQKYIVAKVAEIPPGNRKLVEVRGRKIVIFNVAGEFYGLFNACPHLGGSLCEGYMTGYVRSDRPGEYSYEGPGQVLRCPWHGWEFDVKTGKSYFSPQQVMVRTAKVDVEHGRDLCAPAAAGAELAASATAGATVGAPVEGPYTAETVPVSQEDDYVVLYA